MTPTDTTSLDEQSGTVGGAARRGRARAAFEHRLRELAAPRLAVAGFNAQALAKTAAMSLRTLQLRMQKHALPPPAAWLRDLRLQHAQALLQSGRFSTVGEIAAEVGMSRPYFCRLYRARIGRPPGADLWKAL